MKQIEWRYKRPEMKWFEGSTAERIIQGSIYLAVTAVILAIFSPILP